MATTESFNLIHHDGSLSSINDENLIDEDSTDSIMATVRAQEQQFALLTKEIENERKNVAQQLNHDHINDMVCYVKVAAENISNNESFL